MKVIACGNDGAGKRMLFCDGPVSEASNMLGFLPSIYSIEFSNAVVQFNIWIVGERIPVLDPIFGLYFIGTGGVIVVIDMSMPDRAGTAARWLAISRERVPSVPVVIAGTKLDLVPESALEGVNEEMDGIARHAGATYFPVSSLYRVNGRKDIMMLLASQIYRIDDVGAITGENFSMDREKPRPVSSGTGETDRI
jgi:GTPase SAR1 family protein